MSLLQDSRRIESSSKKIYIMCGAGIIVLIFIMVALLAMVTAMKKNKVTLIINGQSCETKDYLIKKDDTIYIGLESLTKAISKGGYTYKRGNKDIEDENQCYITNASIQESVFFTVGSDEICKTMDGSNEVYYYKISKPVIKENEKIYIPIADCKVALNMKYTKNNNQYNLSSIEYIESYYNQQSSNTFVPNTSIVWDTLADNKKLLRDGLAIIKDGSGNLGIASVTTSDSGDKKKKVTTVSVTEVLTPKYKYIRYVEKYDQLIVETTSGRGIVEFKKLDNGEYSIKTIISPQYDDIKQLDKERFIISKISNKNSNNASDKVTKYGIIDINGEEVLPTEYQKIGVDLSKYTNNNLVNGYILFDYLIPVKKNDLWGLVNLNGQTVLECSYTDLGCSETNPSTNVLIIPEKELIIVKNDNKYGIVNKTGKAIIKAALTKVYQETVENEKKYYMIYNDKKMDIIKYLDSKQTTTTQDDTKVIETVTEDKTTDNTENKTSDNTTTNNTTDTTNKDDSSKVTVIDNSKTTEKNTTDNKTTKNDNQDDVIL